MKTRKMRMVVLVLAVLSTTLASTAEASTVLYESAANHTTFQPSFGLSIQDHGSTSSQTQFHAKPFTLSQQSLVTGMELALTAPSADSADRYTVQILGDVGGLPNLSPLWMASSKESAPVYLPLSQPYSFTSVSGDAVLLEANTQYWLYVSCGGICELSWWADGPNMDTVASRVNNRYPYDLRWVIEESYDAMFRVTGVSAVPEPETYAMMLGGLVLVGAAVRRRREKFRNQASPQMPK